MKVSRRNLLAGAAAFWGLVALGPARAEAPLTALRPPSRPVPPIPPTLDEIIADAGPTGLLGCMLVDATTGELIEAQGADTRLPPASVAKAVTALYALASLGPAYRFQTRLLANGPLVDSVVQGDLILAGGGDPVLTTDHLGAMAERLRAAGVRGVTGSFLVWGGALPEQHQIASDQQAHLGYNPAIGGLNVNFNRVHFEWARTGDGSYSITMDARSARFRPDVTVARMRVADREVPVYTYEDTGDADRWTVARAALGDGGARWLPVRKPAQYAGEVFRLLAAAQGVSLPEARVSVDLPEGEALVTHDSDPLDAMLRDMLEYSTNITAECIGLAASLARGLRPATLADSAGAMSRWAEERLGARGDFVDHSGLGDASAISASEMTRALVSAYAGGALPALLKPIVLLDAQGDALANPPADVVAKTGTLNFVSGLGGYIRRPGRNDLAFAIFSADQDRRAAAKAQGDEVPEGARGWNRRARGLQHALLRRWADV